MRLPDAPVSELELFVGLHAAVVRQQEAEGVTRHVEDARCLTRVKHVDDVEPEISLQPVDVHVGSVEHLRGRFTVMPSTKNHCGRELASNICMLRAPRILVFIQRNPK